MTVAKPRPGEEWTPTVKHRPSAERMVVWRDRDGVLRTGWCLGNLWLVPNNRGPTYFTTPALWRYVA